MSTPAPTSWNELARARPYVGRVQELEDAYQLPKGLLGNLLRQESGFDPTAMSPAGAQGIAQIMPNAHPDVEPLDPEESMDYAAKYLRQLHDQFGDWDKALAAYNWGPGNLSGAIDARGEEWQNALPTETRNYLAALSPKQAVSGQAVPQDDLPDELAAGRPVPLDDLPDDLRSPLSDSYDHGPATRYSASNPPTPPFSDWFNHGPAARYSASNPPTPSAPPSPYDTQLAPDDELLYRGWMKRIGHTPEAGYRVDDDLTGGDYDYRGFFQKYGPVDVAGGQHLTDEFKKPSHETFSVESKYATGQDSAAAGSWLDEQFIPPPPADLPLTQTVTTEAPRFKGEPSWADTLLSRLPQAIWERGKKKVVGAEEFLPEHRYADAQKQMWQALVLPDAMRRYGEARARGESPNLWADPSVVDAAQHLGMRPDQFVVDAYDFANMTPEQVEAIRQEAQATLIEEGPKMTPFAQRRANIESELQRLQPDVNRWSPKGITYNVGASIPDLLAAAGAGYVGGPMAGIGVMAASIAPEMRADALNAGLSGTEADLFTAMMTGAEAIPELPVLQQLFHTPGAQQFVMRRLGARLLQGGRKLATGAAGEAGSEAFTETLEQQIQRGMQGKEMSLGDALADIAYAGVTGAGMGGPLGAVAGAGDFRQESAQQNEFMDANAARVAAQFEAQRAGKPTQLYEPDEHLADLQGQRDALAALLPPPPVTMPPPASTGSPSPGPGTRADSAPVAPPAQGPASQAPWFPVSAAATPTPPANLAPFQAEPAARTPTVPTPSPAPPAGPVSTGAAPAGEATAVDPDFARGEQDARAGKKITRAQAQQMLSEPGSAQYIAGYMHHHQTSAAPEPTPALERRAAVRMSGDLGSTEQLEREKRALETGHFETINDAQGNPVRLVNLRNTRGHGAIVAFTADNQHAGELHFSTDKNLPFSRFAVTPLDSGIQTAMRDLAQRTGGFVEPPKKPKAAAAPRAKQSPSILEYVSGRTLHGAQTRGINFAEAVAHGLDPKELRGARARAFTKGGASLDAWAEHLAEAGYPVKDARGNYDPNVLLDLITRELRQGHRVTAEGRSFEDAEQRAAEQAASLEEQARLQALEEVGAMGVENAKADLQPGDLQDPEDIRLIAQALVIDEAEVKFLETLYPKRLSTERDAYMEGIRDIIARYEHQGRTTDEGGAAVQPDRGRAGEADTGPQEAAAAGAVATDLLGKPLKPAAAQEVKPREQQADFVGGKTQTQQDLADEQRRRDEKRSDVPPGTGGGLFSDERKQTDIADVTEKPAPKPAPAAEPAAPTNRIPEDASPAEVARILRASMTPQEQQEFMAAKYPQTAALIKPKRNKQPFPWNIEMAEQELRAHIEEYDELRSRGLEGFDDVDLASRADYGKNEEPREIAQRALSGPLGYLAERIAKDSYSLERAKKGKVAGKRKGGGAALAQAVESTTAEDLLEDEEVEQTEEEAAAEKDEGERLELRRAKKKTSKRRPGPYSITREGEIPASPHDRIWTDAGLDPDAMTLLPPEQQYAKAAQLVQARFGFSSIARANNLQIGEAIDALKDAYVGLSNHAAVLNVNPSVMSLDGWLNLQLAREGKRGELAHYNPGTHTILMVRRNDAFAHEWAHALDHWLQEHYAPELLRQRGQLLTGKIRTGGEPTTLDDQVKDAFIGVLNALFFDQAKQALHIADLQAKIAKAKTDKQKAKYQAQIDNYSKGHARVTPTIASDYYERAKGMEGGVQLESDSKKAYWQKPTEMFARAYEAYIADKVNGYGAAHPFSTQAKRFYDESRLGTFPSAYPLATDRSNIFAALDTLMRAVRDRNLVPHDQPATIQPASEVYWKKQAPQLTAPQLRGMRGIAARIRERWVAGREADKRDAASSNFRRAQNKKLRQARLNAAGHGGRRRYVHNVGMIATDSLNSAQRGFAHTIRGVLFSLDEMHKGNTGLAFLVNNFATDPGASYAQRGVQKEKWEETVRQEDKRWHNRFAEVVSKHQINDYDEAQLATLRDELVNVTPASPVTPEIRAAAADLRRFMNDLYAYNQQHGVNIGYVKENGFLPRNPDRMKVEENQSGFMTQATKLYSQVYEDEIGAVEALIADPKKLDNLMQYVREIAQSGNVTEARDAAEQLQPVVEEIRAKRREIAKAKEAEEETDELEEQLAELVQALHEGMRKPWALEAANDWMSRILGQGPVTAFQMEAHGPNSKYTKSRRLPAAADALMKDYLITDPLQLIATYTTQSVRRVQFGRFFGEATSSKPLGWKLNEAFTALRQNYTAADGSTQRISEEDVEELQTSVQLMLNTYQHNLTKRGMRFRTKLNSFYMPYLLSRSLWAQFAEPVSIGWRSGDVRDTFRAYYLQMQDLAGKLGLKNAKQRALFRREMSEYLGVTSDHLADQMMKNRYNLMWQNAADQKSMARMFNMIGVHPHAMSMKRAAVDVFMMRYAPKWAERALKGGKRGQQARDALAELGLDSSNKELLAELAKLPTITDTAALEQLTYLPQIRTALNRFVEQAIADPKVVDKPRMASQPEWSFMYGIMSFNFAFQRNMIIASGKRIARDWQTDPTLGAATAGSVAAGVSLLMGAQFAAWVLREVLFGDDDWDKLEKRISEEGLWQSMSRSGLFGAADPVVNAFLSLKYERDLTALMAGSIFGTVLNIAGRGIGAALKNSEQTPNSEKVMIEAAWDGFLGPYALAKVVQLGGRVHPAIGAALGLVVMPLIGSRRVKQGAKALAEELTGQEFDDEE